MLMGGSFFAPALSAVFQRRSYQTGSWREPRPPILDAYWGHEPKPGRARLSERAVSRPTRDLPHSRRQGTARPTYRFMEREFNGDFVPLLSNIHRSRRTRRPAAPIFSYTD